MEYKKVSIIIPIYNERSTIEQVLNEVHRASTLGLEKEIILVDDFSTDGSRDFLQKLNRLNLKVFFHDQNQGKGSAIKTALRNLTGEIVLIQDADLEYDPADFTGLLAP